MKADWIQARQTKYSAYVTVYILVVLAVLALAVTYFGETGQFPAARDLLGRYANLSAKLKVDYIDPVKKPQLARAAGVRQLGTIVVDAGERKEDATSLTESDITGALVRSLKGGERNVCFLTGSGEHGLDDTNGGGFSTLKQALEHNNYKARSVNHPQPAAPPRDGAGG